MTQEKREVPMHYHVSFFADKEMKYNGKTVAEGLSKLNAKDPGITGELIAIFNSSHVCPFSRSGIFKPDEKNGYADTLHLGTTRIWKTNGKIDEERWNQFANYVSQGQDKQIKVPLSLMFKYLDVCIEKDGEEPTTGRNTNGLIHSQWLQHKAAKAGWEKIYELMAIDPDIKDPVMTLDKHRAFFENTELALKNAYENRQKNNQEPVQKII